MPAGFTRGPNGDIFTDENGVVRWQTGLLPQNGVSPAHWGARSNGPDGSPQWDSLGLIAVMTQLANAPITATTVTTANNVTYAMVANSAIPFTLARQSGMLAFYGGAGLNTGASGTFSYVYIFIDGTRLDNTYPSGLGSRMLFDRSNTGYTNGFIFGWLPTLAAGPHTIDIRAATDTGVTLNFQTTDGVVIRTGS